jgi:hypothetical protein
MTHEVFLQDVPSINGRVLRNELVPLMWKLNINDFIIDKPRDKPMAWVRFLDPNDAQRFLEKYGTVGPHRKLTISGAKIRVVRSTKEVDAFAMGALRRLRTERLTKLARRGAGGHDDDSGRAEAVVLNHMSLSCGHNMFINKTLTFIEEWKMGGLMAGITRFGRRMIVIKLNLGPGRLVRLTA